MEIINDGQSTFVDPCDLSSLPPSWLRERKIWDANINGWRTFDPADPVSVFNAIQHLLGPQPVAPDILPGTSLVPVTVPGIPGLPGMQTLRSFIVDPSREAELTAEQNEYNQAVTLYVARMTALFSQVALLTRAKLAAKDE